MVNLLAAAALAAATPAAAACRDRRGEPAMFVVRDADTTIYIFGTFHALDGQDAMVRRPGSRCLRAIGRAGAGDADSRTARAARSWRRRFARPSVTPSASFLATTRMAISAGRSQGMQVDNGADMVLRHAAEAEGKPVEGPGDAAIPARHVQPHAGDAPPPRRTVAAANRSGPARCRACRKRWRTCRRPGSAAIRACSSACWPSCGGIARHLPNDVHRAERALGRLDRARMQAPGTVFVAVGAGHLAGPDSLLVRLAERGIPSQRVH